MKEINTEKIHPLIRNLLSYATSEFRIDEEYNKYLKSPNRKLFGLECNGKYVGCIGFEMISPKECVISHIAVFPEQREKGIGSKMINFLSNQFCLISAETDKDGVDFYRKYGFMITSLGEKYPGVERFQCEFRNESIC